MSEYSVLYVEEVKVVDLLMLIQGGKASILISCILLPPQSFPGSFLLLLASWRNFAIAHATK